MATVSNPSGNTLLTTGTFPPVRVATTGTAIVLNGLQAIDGVALAAGDRVLVKDQSDQTTNGIYAVSTGNWPRTSDAASSAQFFNGMAVNVAQGAQNAGQTFYNTTTDDPVVIGTSLLTFASQSSVMAAQQEATSTTSLTIGVGAKTLAIQSGKAFQPNQAVLVFETAAPTNCMYGTVTSYTGASLVVNVTAVNGSGTHADWTVVLFSSPAAAGIAPPLGTGNTTGAGSSTAGHLAVFADASGKVLNDGGAAGALANLSTAAAAQLANSALGFGDGMINGTLVESHSGNAVTFAIKTLAGADPSASDPVYVIFRDATSGLPALGSFTVITLTAATSFTFSSGSSAGSTNGNPFRIWLVGVNDAGTFRLGAINCSTPTQIYPLNETALVTTVAEGGAGAAKSAGTIYTGAQATSKAMRILGYAEYGSGLATAGTWNVAPSAIQLFGPGVKKPGDVIGRQYQQTGTYLTTTNTYTPSATLPVPANGLSTGLALTFAAQSPANFIRIRAQALCSAAASGNITIFLHDGSVAKAVVVSDLTGNSGLTPMPIGFSSLVPSSAGVPTSTTYTFYFCSSSGAVGTYLNGYNGTQYFGSASATFMEIEEIMG